MTQIERARLFASLHVKGNPIVLFNVWDAGSARAVAEAGAKAIASGSWSVAAAHGVEDGEEFPFDSSLANAARIVRAVDLPVTIDFEAGYAGSPEAVGANARRLIEVGAVGCNFEDQVINGNGLYPIAEQGARISAIRRAADEAGVPFFINARTDIFLQTNPDAHDQTKLYEAAERAAAYENAGANGIFAPGLTNAELIRKLCEQTPLPVNIMFFPGVPPARELAALGVARVSHGPGPYRAMFAALKAAASAAFAEASEADA